MCGRYSFSETDYDRAIDELGLAHSQRVRSAAAGELFPGAPAPVVSLSRAGRAAPFVMRWGFCLSDGKRIINGRSETADERALFRESAALRRCLVPAAQYYEWSLATDGKRKYAFSAAQSPLLYMCGVYRIAADEPQFVILTREAVGRAREIHPRMPLLLQKDSACRWIDRALSYRQALALCTMPPLVFCAV